MIAIIFKLISKNVDRIDGKTLPIIELKKFNETLTQRQQSMEELSKSLMGLHLRRDSVVDDIKTIRTDVPFIELEKNLKTQLFSNSVD